MMTIIMDDFAWLDRLISDGATARTGALSLSTSTQRTHLWQLKADRP